jgi:hypothetical protein
MSSAVVMEIETPGASFENIPSAMKNEPRFVVWMRNGQKKVPFGPSGRPASITNRATWQAFGAARRQFDMGGFDGLGFVAGDGWLCIDVDNCLNRSYPPDGRVIIPLVVPYLLRNVAGYCEISPSGNGVHLWTKGRLPDDAKRIKFSILPPGIEPPVRVEFLGPGHYATLTGCIYKGCNDVPTNDQSGPISDVYAFLMKYYSKNPITPGGEPDAREDGEGDKDEIPASVVSAAIPTDDTPDESDAGPELPDREVVRLVRVSRQKDKFNALMRGDWRSLGYPSHSEGVRALLMILCFWTRKNPNQIDRIFRTSRLFERKKWFGRYRRGTFGQFEIQRAISECVSVYKGTMKKRHTVLYDSDRRAALQQILSGDEMIVLDELTLGFPRRESVGGFGVFPGIEKKIAGYTKLHFRRVRDAPKSAG